jgi:uncharacterized protein
MRTEFTGSWLATSRGGMWSIENPQEEQVHLADIAAGLSRTCRYAGQISEEVTFYSVAEHSVIMTFHAYHAGLIQTRSEALCYLLHDGSEAYFGDMTTPLKALVPQFRVFEDRAQSVIFSAFGIGPDLVARMKPELKRIDTRIRLDEREVMICEPALSAGRDALWGQDPSLEPLGITPALYEPTRARQIYLEAFAWALEALPDDLGATRALRDAARYLTDRGVLPVLPDFPPSYAKEAACAQEFSPC